MNLSTEQLQMGALIDAKMQRLLREGHDEVSIIGEMFDCMPFFKMLLDSGQDTMDELCQRLPASITMQRSLKRWRTASGQGRFKCRNEAGRAARPRSKSPLN